MNEEEAKSILKNMDIGISGNTKCKECIFDDETRCFRDGKDCQMIAIETVLNLLQKQQSEIEQLKNKNKHQSKEMQKAVDYTFELNKEIEKKDKIIDEMAEWLYEDDTSFGYGKLKDVNTPEKIKQYFERKIK